MSESVLSNVSSIIETHREDANNDGDFFNIFNILKVRRNEVSTHSRFIFELLNPRGSHGEGEKFTRLFVKIFCPEFTLAVESGKFTVQREAKTSGGRRVDFIIKSAGSYLIGIEMKIDAADQENQLYDYNIELKNRLMAPEQLKLIYLTLDGKPADESSLNGLREKDYQRASFIFEIIDWLEGCIKKTSKSELKAAILQYKRLVESLTGVSRTLSKKITNEITSSSESFNSALEIAKTLNQAKTDLQMKFWKELIIQFKNTGTDFDWFGKTKGNITDSDLKKLVARYYGKAKKPIGLKFEIGSKKVGSQPYHFYFTLRLWDAIHYGVTVEDGFELPLKTDEDLKTTWQQKYHEISNFKSASEAKALGASDWVLSFYNTTGGDIINFWLFDQHAQDVIYKEGLLEKEIKKIIEHQHEMVNFIRNNIL